MAFALAADELLAHNYADILLASARGHPQNPPCIVPGSNHRYATTGLRFGFLGRVHREINSERSHKPVSVLSQEENADFDVNTTKNGRQVVFRMTPSPKPLQIAWPFAPMGRCGCFRLEDQPQRKLAKAAFVVVGPAHIVRAQSGPGVRRIRGVKNRKRHAGMGAQQTYQGPSPHRLPFPTSAVLEPRHFPYRRDHHAVTNVVVRTAPVEPGCLGSK